MAYKSSLVALAAAATVQAVPQGAYGTWASTTAAPSYACNPAHDYGNGQSCISQSGTLTLVGPSSSAPAVTTSSAYVCNPAHEYPTGQTCVFISGTPILSTVPTANSAAATTSAYLCNPAHAYPTGATCVLNSGSYVLSYTPTASSGVASSAVPSTTGSANNCYAKYNACRGAPDANFSLCASQYASCLGYNPFASNGTNTVTPVVSQPDVYVTQVVTAFTTVCPSPTTLTYNNKTYTVTKPTTLTITDCPCKVTTPVKSLPPATTVTAVVPHVTYDCPSPTTTTIQSKTYTVSTSTVITVSCPGGCTVTTPVSQLPATSQPAVSQPAVSQPAVSQPVAQPSVVSVGTPLTRTASTTAPVKATSTGPAVYTGAANKIVPGMMLGALGLLAL